MQTKIFSINELFRYYKENEQKVGGFGDKEFSNYASYYGSTAV